MGFLRIIGIAAALAGASCLGAGAARAAGPDYLTFGAGVFDFSDDGVGAGSIEYTDGGRWIWHFQPMTGLMVTGEGSVFGYAGLSLDIFFGRRIVLTPSFAPGLYFEGGGKDLGSVLEFRSSIKLAYRFDNHMRLGLDLHHLSNAGLGDKNPGANNLMLTLSVPLNGGP